MSDRCVVILAGGPGERFWPVSQPDNPKPFLSVFGEPLLRLTLKRLSGFASRAERLIVVPQTLRSLARRSAPGERLLLEPVGRNTAAAIALAALVAERGHGDRLMHIIPADHLIQPAHRFTAALRYGEVLARQGMIVTYGVKPTRPETGYGYIRLGRAIRGKGGVRAFRGSGFIEKPSLRQANVFQKAGTHVWNAGIFTFLASTLKEELARHAPRLLPAVTRYVTSGKAVDFARVPSVSIDYAVMEKTSRLAVVRGDFRWDDVGTWLALERHCPKDRQGNVVAGDCRVLETKDSIVYTDDRPVRVLDVTGLVIVASPHGVLVCSKKRAAGIKELSKNSQRRLR